MDILGAVGRVRNPFDLPTHQKRLRHLKSISMRNVQCKSFKGHDVSKMDAYFTLHKDKISPAAYTSEKIKGSMNPTWKSFDTSYFEDKLDTISTNVVIKIWIQLDSSVKLLVDLEVYFNGIIFLADKLQMEGVKYYPNTVIFGMFDKYFIESTSTGTGDNSTVMKILHVYTANQRPSYNSNSLSRVHTILRAVKQTQALVNRVHNSIEDELLMGQHLESKLSEREELLLKIHQLHNELRWQTNKLQSDKDKYDRKREAIRNRYERLKANKMIIKESRLKQAEDRQTCNQQREKWIKESAQLLIRRKQLIGELSTSVFPVTETEKPEYFICGVKLPNSESYQGQDETMIAIALGNTCHLTLMISQILNLPLRYAMEFRGSRSQIRDHIHIKLIEKDRNFPLYSKGKEKFQFNYGVFLLNKNISQLRFYCGLGTSDLRLTLPNIKSLLELRLGVKGEYQMPRNLTSSVVGGGGNSTNSLMIKDGTRSTAGSSSASSSNKQDQSALLQSLDTEISELHGLVTMETNSDLRSDMLTQIKKPTRDEREEVILKTDDSFFKFSKQISFNPENKIAQCDDVIDAINIKANFNLQTTTNSNGLEPHIATSSSNCDNTENVPNIITDNNSKDNIQNGNITSAEVNDSASEFSILSVPLDSDVTKTKGNNSDEFSSSTEFSAS